MDSAALTSPPIINRWLPFAAVVTEDYRQTFRHWAFIAWLVLGVALTCVWFVHPEAGLSTLLGTHHAEPTTAAVSMPSLDIVETPALSHDAKSAKHSAAQYGSKLIGNQLLLWTTFVLALGVSGIAGEAEFVADAILCRGISRWQYFIGKCVSRISVAVGLYLLLTVPAVLLATFKMTNDLTANGLMTGLGIGAGLTAAIALFAVAGGVWFRHPPIGFAVLWMTVYGIGIVTSILKMSDLSPVVWVERLGDILRGVSNIPPHHLPMLIVCLSLSAAGVSIISFCTRDL